MRILRICDKSCEGSDDTGSFSGFTVEFAASGTEGLDRLASSGFDAVVATLPLADCSAETLLEQIQQVQTSLPVIFCAPDGNMAVAVRLTKLGAFHFTISQEPEALRQAIEAAAQYRQSLELSGLRCAVASEPWRKFLIGE